MLKREELDLANNEEGCLGKAADDEPVFILRAKDVLAPIAVRRWADMLEAASHPDDRPRRDKAMEARKLARDMEAWSLANGGKIPD